MPLLGLLIGAESESLQNVHIALPRSISLVQYGTEPRQSEASFNGSLGVAKTYGDIDRGLAGFDEGGEFGALIERVHVLGCVCDVSSFTRFGEVGILGGEAAGNLVFGGKLAGVL